MKKNFWVFCAFAGIVSLWLAVFRFPQPAGAARLLAVTASLTPSPTPIPVSVLSPQSGQAVQGVVPVTVQTVVEGFLGGELYFGYAGDPTGTWFLIGQQDEAMSGVVFATWDTTTITDGNYTLLLVVTVRDGAPILYRVEGLRVRNYSPVETDTPTPSPTPPPGDLPTHTPTRTSTLTPIPLTPTPLPTNPAVVGVEQFGKSAGVGALAVVVGIGLLGIYASMRQGIRRK